MPRDVSAGLDTRLARHERPSRFRGGRSFRFASPDPPRMARTGPRRWFGATPDSDLLPARTPSAGILRRAFCWAAKFGSPNPPGAPSGESLCKAVRLCHGPLGGSPSPQHGESRDEGARPRPRGSWDGPTLNVTRAAGRCSSVGTLTSDWARSAPTKSAPAS